MPKINEEKREERRATILRSAFQVFSRKGYANASMEDIVQESGMSKGGIYHYFKSKEELFLALAEKRFQKRRAILGEERPGSSPSARLVKYLREALINLGDESVKQEVRFAVEFWSVRTRESDVLKISKPRYRQFSDDLSQILHSGVESGEFRKNLEINATTYLILCALDGVGFVTSVMGIPPPPRTVDRFVEMVMKDLLHNSIP